MKKIFYFIIIVVLGVTISINLFSNLIIEEFEEYSEIYIDRNHLYDTAIVCTQLYYFDPTEVNKLTCKKINDKIDVLNDKLSGFYLVNIYLSTLNEHNK